MGHRGRAPCHYWTQPANPVPTAPHSPGPSSLGRRLVGSSLLTMPRISPPRCTFSTSRRDDASPISCGLCHASRVLMLGSNHSRHGRGRSARTDALMGGTDWIRTQPNPNGRTRPPPAALQLARGGGMEEQWADRAHAHHHQAGVPVESYPSISPSPHKTRGSTRLRSHRRRTEDAEESRLHCREILASPPQKRSAAAA